MAHFTCVGSTVGELRETLDAMSSAGVDNVLALRGAVRDRGPITAFEAVPAVHGAEPTAATASWWVQETLCYLRHLEVTEQAVVERDSDDAPERWRLTG